MLQTMYIDQPHLDMLRLWALCCPNRTPITLLAVLQRTQSPLLAKIKDRHNLYGLWPWLC